MPTELKGWSRRAFTDPCHVHVSVWSARVQPYVAWWLGFTAAPCSPLAAWASDIHVDEPITVFGMAYVGSIVGLYVIGALAILILRRRNRNPSTRLPLRIKSKRVRGPA